MSSKDKLFFHAFAILALLAAVVGVPSSLAQAEPLSRPPLANGDYLWAKGWGGTGRDWGTSIAIDLNGNIYTTGYFLGTVDFDPGPGTAYISSVDIDIFISKLDNNGALAWVKSMGGSGPNAASTTNTSNDIAIDNKGHVYITGKFCGTTDFDPGPGLTALTSSGPCDLYITELDDSGNFIKVKNIGGTYAEVEGQGITLDTDGNIYTTGRFTHTADFDPGTGQSKLTSLGQWDIFISKLDNDGNYIFAKDMGGISDEQGVNMVVDKIGSIYTVGNYTGTVDFDPGSGVFNLPNCGYSGMGCGFMSKLDNWGNFVLAKQLDHNANDIALDSGNNVLVAGSIAYPTDYIVIYKLDSGGNVIWRNEMGTAPSYGSSGSSIAVDISDNVYVTGDFSGTVDFDPGPGTYNLTSDGVNMYDDVFVSKWDSQGNLVMAKAMGGPLFDQGTDIAVDLQGNMYTTGLFQGTADFDPGPGTVNLISVYDYDIFVSELDGDIIPPIFTDVPFSYWANSYVERLYKAGVTGGCLVSPMRYCPATAVTRDQMAVLLLRAKHGSAYTPPAATGTMFADVPENYWAAAWIEQLANEGITTGCGGGNFCPEASVTRDQMAIFLLRSEHGSAYTPPVASGTMFADVPSSHWAAKWIEQLANEGITGGCGGGNYCPNVIVTRDQMAVFLVKAFGLP